MGSFGSPFLLGSAGILPAFFAASMTAGETPAWTAGETPALLDRR
jgi:hypothetical protein